MSDNADPVPPQRPVAPDMAKGSDSSAAIVVARCPVLHDIAEWRMLGEAIGRQAITGMHYTDAGNIAITGPMILGGSAICTSATDAIEHLREALSREKKRNNHIAALMATLGE